MCNGISGIYSLSEYGSLLKSISRSWKNSDSNVFSVSLKSSSPIISREKSLSSISFAAASQTSPKPYSALES